MGGPGEALAGQPVTLILGVASYIPGPGENQELLIQLADHQLNLAKQSGRNRVQP